MWRSIVKRIAFTSLVVLLFLQTGFADDETGDLPKKSFDNGSLPLANTPSCFELNSHCKKLKLVVPIIRIVLVDIAMHVILSALWPDVFDPTDVKNNAARFKKNWSTYPDYNFNRNIFGTDDDWWQFNFFTHALYGSEAYIAARGWQNSVFTSFLFSVFASFTWEYLVEAWYKKPSAIDLFWTPLGGALLGEIRYRFFTLAKRIDKKGARIFVQILIDPLGQLERLIFRCQY